MTDPLSTTRRLIAIFDAIADAPDTIGAGLSLHDRDGTLVKTFKSWASAREFKVEYRLGERGEDRWDQFSIEFSDGRRIIVHGESVERAGTVAA